MASLQEQAKTLIKSPAAKGNHGFKGKQLAAWVRQRSFWMKKLGQVAKTGRTLGWQTDDPRCPREVVDKTITIPGKRVPGVARKCGICKIGEGCNSTMVTGSKSKKNPAWTGGTVAGARWVERASRLVQYGY